MCIDGLADVGYEILLGGPGPLQSIGSDHFQVPRHHLAVGILHIHIEIGVRIFPRNGSQGAL